jgi:hypothetical protein
MEKKRGLGYAFLSSGGKAPHKPNPTSNLQLFSSKQPRNHLSSSKPHNSNKTKEIKMKFSYAQTHIINL